MSTGLSQEKLKGTMTGYLIVLVGPVAIGVGVWMFLSGATSESPFNARSIGGLVLIVVGILTLTGLYMLQPNQCGVLTLFGRYVGTDRHNGLRWANPFFRKTKVSLRAHNFVSDRIKVNDARGNPIEIAAAIVWRVRDSAQALFDVEDYEAYVRVQAETAIRHLASSYPYDEGIADIESGDVEPRRVVFGVGCAAHHQRGHALQLM